MSADILHSAFKAEPYWWEAAPRRPRDDPVLPPRADVVVVGSGYTGLSAALTLARAGREVVVLDSGAPGSGASSRNAGYLGTALLAPFSQLLVKHGTEKAVAWYGQAKAAFDYTSGLIEHEQIRCDYDRCGRVYWAYTQAQLDGLERELDCLHRHLGKDGEILRGGRIAQESGSRLYCGGLLLPETASLHPAFYHQGLLELAEAAGAKLVGHAAANDIQSISGGHRVTTPRGVVEARDVVVATNGYVGRETPWFRRRMLPVTAYMIATAPLDPDLVGHLVPGGRTHLDARTMFHYWRASPDGTRILFGGRTGLDDRTPEAAARAHHAEMAQVFPELEGERISHFWSGQISLTCDRLPHIGVREGVHFALGMNGAGVPMGTYLGHKVALKLLAGDNAETAFDDLAFNAIPFHWSRRWFVPALARLVQARHACERPPAREN